MSGGTDSSVAALLLQDAGYEVTGVTFRFYEKEGDTEYLDDARTLCKRLKIKHISYDVRNIFRETIIDYFIREYMAGHTLCTACLNRRLDLMVLLLTNQASDCRAGKHNLERCHSSMPICCRNQCL